jgi:DNA-binding transcriptional MerR regulator
MPAGRPKGSKTNPELLKKPKPKKHRLNCIYVSEHVHKLLRSARDKGYSVAKILEMLVIENTDSKQTAPGEYLHTLRVQKQDLGETTSEHATIPELKWHSRNKRQ